MARKKNAIQSGGEQLTIEDLDKAFDGAMQCLTCMGWADPRFPPPPKPKMEKYTDLELKEYQEKELEKFTQRLLHATFTETAIRKVAGLLVGEHPASACGIPAENYHMLAWEMVMRLRGEIEARVTAINPPSISIWPEANRRVILEAIRAFPPFKFLELVKLVRHEHERAKRRLIQQASTKANTSKKKMPKMPKNDMVQKLIKRRADTKNDDKSTHELAMEITEDDESKAKSIESQARRYRKAMKDYIATNN